jgi:lipopolysaccharide transport system ATP-binding protein
MSDSIISVQNLSKRYLLGHQGPREKYTALRDVISRNVKNLARTTRDMLTGHQVVEGDEVEEFWALQDVSFEVKRGEVLGIIGRNGAGKSTLFKILSRITEPTKGRIEINGRVASLLEVGTGFHPELTGRENIFLNGAILGMTRAEIRRKFDEIVAFAEVEKFLDTPVKRYSSGMYVRLAFAVAAHLEPEILIVDEVLAVGDAQFQKKCMGKMQDVAAKDGRTVLFVSHNMSAVLQLTSSAIVLEKGREVFQGPSEKAVELYANIGVSEATTNYNVENTPRRYLGTQAARIISLKFERTLPMFSFGEDFTFIAKIRGYINIENIRFSMTIFTGEGVPVGSCFSIEKPGINAGTEVEIRVMLQNPKLAPGRYYCGVAIGKGDNRTGHIDFDVVLDTLIFEVQHEKGEGGTVSSWAKEWGPMVFPQLHQEKITY